LNSAEKNLVKRAIVATKPELGHMDLTPEKTEDLLLILNTYRARGYLMPRRFDGGKDSDLWREVRRKLGHPIKSQEQLIEESARKTATGLLERLSEGHNAKIGRLEERLKLANKEKENAINGVEDAIMAELAAVEAAKAEILNRAEGAKEARKQLKITKKLAELEEDRKPSDGMVKCWPCGGWFNEGIGFRNHQKACLAKHPEAEQKV